MEIRSAIWLNAGHTAANCELFTDTLGVWVPYTVSADSLSDGLAKDVWEALKTVVVQEPAPEPESLKVARARLVRDKYLEDTDVFMLIDYPITEERRATGIFSILDITDNTVISNLKNYKLILALLVYEC